LRILIVKISSMGDVIHNLPIIEDIRTHFPDAEIDWVVEENFIEIVALHPMVNHAIPIAFRRWRRNLFSRKTYLEIISSLKSLRKNKYDYIIDTQGLIKSAIICLCAHGVRIGRDWQSNREAFASLFYQRHFRVKFNQHAVNRGRQLTAMALGYPVPKSPPKYGLLTENIASNIEEGLGLPKKYVMCLHATSRNSKLWPIQNWIQLGQALAKQGFILVLPWASNIELERAKAIAKGVLNAIILPKLGLKKLAEITAGAKASIGVDTGLIHLSVALKIPSIAIYINTDPNLNGAYAAENSVAINIGGKSLCPSVDDVLHTLLKLNISV
jgi:heptosyltransferase-1